MFIKSNALLTVLKQDNPTIKTRQEMRNLLESAPEQVETRGLQDEYEEIVAERQAWAKNGYEFITNLDKMQFPEGLSETPNTPQWLFYKGVIGDDSHNAVSIVGSRVYSNPEQVEENAYQTALELSKQGVTVVSGLASGVDALAHQAAVNNRGRTVAVLPNGLDYVYPGENYDLAQQIVKTGGALISEFFPDVTPQRSFFLKRNRTMAAYSQASIVITATERSGSQNHVTNAISLNKPVILFKKVLENNDWAKQMLAEHPNLVRIVNTPAEAAETAISLIKN